MIDPCTIEIPGIGQCELEVEAHPLDGVGRPIHKRGPVTWNGGPAIEVDDVALAEASLAASALLNGPSYCLPCDDFHDGGCPVHP